MRKLLSYTVLSLVLSMTFVSCHESLEDRAERESKEYTEKFCPTPPQNNVITDSLVFDKATKTQIYYMRLTGPIDDPEVIKECKADVEKGMLASLRQDPKSVAYKDAAFSFRYVCSSEKNPKMIYLDIKFGPKDYGFKE